MARPIVIAHHLIFTAFGWWLPNDPRGSSSHAIATNIIAELGALHVGRKRIQPASRDLREFYEQAARVLRHELLTFCEEDVAQIADAFGEVLTDCRYTCWACAIMPGHVHVLIRKHRDKAEEMIGNLQRRSRKRLWDANSRPNDHPVWGGPGWKVFLERPDDVRRTIHYVEQNPVKLGRPIQRWSFVEPFDNWPSHEGHNPNSPYAKRLRNAGRYP